MSNIDKQMLAELRKRYTPPEIPKCIICGGELSIQRCGGGEPTVYACDGYEADPENPGMVRRAAGRYIADKHYEESRYIDWIKGGDSDVVALLDELEAAEKRIAELSGEFFALPPLNDDLISILGRQNFTCAHLAELLRKGGQDIRRKAEHEQAAVIYWFLDLYLKYGEKWESIAKDDIQARVAMITAYTSKGE